MILSLILLLLHTPEPEEIRLFNKINEYRVKNGKTALSYCDSLSYVAETHSIDMYFHFDIDNPCSLHTWSFSKFWTGGCIPEGKNDQWHIMYNKPKELLGMKARGYEISYMLQPKDFKITPKDAFDGWIASTPHRNVILEKGWDRPFVRMGVSIYKGIANVWFAQE
jgi:hypothetical protein